MKVQTVYALKATHRLPLLLAAANLPRATYFYHQRRLGQPDQHAELKAAITTSFAQAQERYGHRRIHATIRGQGWRVAKKTVLRLMQQLGLSAGCGGDARIAPTGAPPTRRSRTG